MGTFVVIVCPLDPTDICALSAPFLVAVCVPVVVCGACKLRPCLSCGLVQATIGVGTVMIPYFCVALTRGGRGTVSPALLRSCTHSYSPRPSMCSVGQRHLHLNTRGGSGSGPGRSSGLGRSLGGPIWGPTARDLAPESSTPVHLKARGRTRGGGGGGLLLWAVVGVVREAPRAECCLPSRRLLRGGGGGLTPPPLGPGFHRRKE